MASTDDGMQDGLIDRIYEAGAVPDLWPQVLEETAGIAGGLGAVLWVPNARRWVSTPQIAQTLVEFVESGLAADNPRTNRLVAHQHPGFVTDHDVFRPEEIPNEPIYRDFFIPRGGGLGVATVIPSPSGDTTIIHVERRYADGGVPPEAVAQLDMLRPHFARAALFSARLELQRVEAAAAALELVGLPAAVIAQSGRVMAGNGPFHGLVPDLFQDRMKRLALTDPAADLLFAPALAEVATGANRMVRSIPIPARRERPPVIVHLLPVRGAAHDIFARAVGVVIVTPVVPREVPTAEVIQGLFDLTPAEARVARALGNGETTAEIATASGRSDETVRGQLKAVLSKTGLRRQSDLVGLLRGIPAFGGKDDAGSPAGGKS